MTHANHAKAAFGPVAFAALLTLAAPAAAQTVVAPQPVTADDIAGKPLDDLNLRKDRDKTAPALVTAADAPYAIPGKGRCPALNGAVADLNAALGPDIDDTITPSAAHKREQVVGTTARSLVGSLIPFDGIIRQISGANAAAGHRALYIYAGSVRRAFLKGYAKARGCRIRPFSAQIPPAAPAP